jgi:hypothetical protein
MAERTYIVVGLGKTYTIVAKSTTAAKVKAGILYREEVKDTRPYSAVYYSLFFEPRVVDPKKPGRKAQLPFYAEVNQ